MSVLLPLAPAGLQDDATALVLSPQLAPADAVVCEPYLRVETRESNWTRQRIESPS